MVDPELQHVQDRLVAAVNAQAAYEHARAARDRLVADLSAQNAGVYHLSAELTRERNDVMERSSGLSGFLYALVGDEQLTIEEREAMEAEARLAEALASRDHLHAQVAALDARLAGQSASDLAEAVTAARVAKEEVLIRSNHPDGIALQELAVRVEAIEIELIPLDDAVAAGEAAAGALRSVIDTLDRAANERLEQRDARGAVGSAQAAITVFQRAVDALVTAEDATRGFGTLIGDEDREPFADAWVRALVGKGDRVARLAAARAAIGRRLERVQGQLARVRARRDELSPRREQLLAERARLLL